MSDREESKPDDENESAKKDEQSSGEAGEQSSGDDGEQEAKAKKKPSVFKKPLFWIILAIVVVVLVVGGVLWWLHARQYESTDNAFVDAHIVRIAPEVGGTLTAVADVDNRHVQPGRLLAVIQANGREAQVAEAQANVAQAVATYRQSLAEIDSARASRAQAAAQARAPLATAAKAAADLARYVALQRLDPNAVAATQLDQARAQARSTAAEARAAQRAVRSADAQVAVTQRQASANQTVIGARRAAVEQANATVRDLRITAPVAGQVVNRQVNLGSYVGPGSQLMAIVPDRMWVTANFKETQLELMRIGQPVAIRVDAYPGVDFRGRVDSIQRGAGQAFAVLPPQNATGNYVKVVQRVPVRIEFVRGDGAPDPRRYPIGPGMSVVPTVKVR